MTIQVNVTEQCFPVVLFIVLYKVVLTLESVDEILKCDHSKESCWAVLSCGAVYYYEQDGSNFWVCVWKLLSTTFLWYCFAILNKVILTFEYVDEILKCDHSNESCRAILSCGAVYYAVQGGSNFESVDEILKCDHSNESCRAILSCGAVYYAVQGGSNFWVCGWNPKVWPFKWKLLSSTFLWYCLLFWTSRC